MVDHIQLVEVLHVNALVDGDAPGARAIPPEQSHNLFFEFTE